LRDTVDVEPEPTVEKDSGKDTEVITCTTKDSYVMTEENRPTRKVNDI